jgi:hypothetical protein
MKKWTVMVYMVGGNNLDVDDEGASDMQEMKMVGTSDKFSVVVQFDRAVRKQKTKRYEIMPLKEGIGNALVVKELDETNTGNPKALEDFICWGMERYEAEHYMLVLWNHGRGFNDDDILRRSGLDAQWLKRFRRRPYRGLREKFLEIGRKGLFILPRLKDMVLAGIGAKKGGSAGASGIGFDDSSRDFINSIELRHALGRALVKAKRKLDIIGFDACYMNMLEVLCQASDYAGYMVGTEGTGLLDGWPYDLVLRLLHQEPGITPEDFSRRIVCEVESYYSGESSDSNDIEHLQEMYDAAEAAGDEVWPAWPVTQSAVRAEKLAGLCREVYGFAEALKKTAGQEISAISRILSCVQRYGDSDYADLGDLARLCREYIPAVRAESARVISVLEEAVVKEAHLGEAVEKSTGMSVYLPRSRFSWEINRRMYRELEFGRQDARWAELIDALWPERETVLRELKGEEERVRSRVM